MSHTNTNTNANKECFKYPRAKPEGHLKGQGKSQRGWISHYLPSFGGVQTFCAELEVGFGILRHGWVKVESQGFIGLAWARNMDRYRHPGNDHCSIALGK